MTFDLEFEKLLLMLKDQYHSLFDKRRLKMSKQGQFNFTSDSPKNFDHQSESESEEEPGNGLEPQQTFGLPERAPEIKEENQEIFIKRDYSASKKRNLSNHEVKVETKNKPKLKVPARRYAVKKRYTKQ